MNNGKKHSNRIKNIIIAAIIIAAMTLIGVTGLLIRGRIIAPPSYVKWREEELFCDEFEVKIVLGDKKVSAYKGEELIWNSPKNQRVSDIMICDIDHDGSEELILLCWKRGKYGKNRPTWVTRDEIKWSLHIAVYDIENSKLSPIWMASEIGFDVQGWSFKDGKLALGDTDGNISFWTWDGWGLYKVP